MAQASDIYQLFVRAIRDRKQIVCVYENHPRELCPIILGHSRGQEKALTYQFGGSSNSGLPPDGEWRCLWLAKCARPRCATGLGIAARAIPSRKAASKSSISTSFRRARTSPNAPLHPSRASPGRADHDRDLYRCRCLSRPRRSLSRRRAAGPQGLRRLERLASHPPGAKSEHRDDHRQRRRRRGRSLDRRAYRRRGYLP